MPRVVDLLVTALDVPLTPGSDDGHIGAEGLQGQLETHLVVALAGAAWQMASAPSLMAMSARAFAMQGRAKLVPSR